MQQQESEVLGVSDPLSAHCLLLIGRDRLSHLLSIGGYVSGTAER